jgi:tripartite-type tricarboxylate transporter receptor subunit TctC
MGKRSAGSVGWIFLTSLLVLIWGWADTAFPAATKEADFYKGKAIDCIVPYKTGGGYDAWVRAMSPFFAKLTGATLVIKNMPGAGSLVGTDKLYVSDPNGLTIGILNGPGMMQAQLTEVAGAKFDLLKFTWLGRLTSEQQIVCVGPKSPFKTVEAMQRSSKPVKVGAPGVGSSMFMYAALMAEILGIKIDLISGYETSEEVDLAIIRGELDASWGSFSSKIDTVKNGDMFIVLQSGNVKMPELEKVPNMALWPGLSEEKKSLAELMVALGESGRPMAGPPGMHPERTRFLVEAIKKTMDDPGFVQIAKKQQMEIIYMPPDDLLKTMEKGVRLAPNAKKRLVEIVGRYQPKR